MDTAATAPTRPSPFGRYENILVSVEDRVATITFNRPERMNAWNAAMGAEVAAAVKVAEGDAEIRAIVLTGAGRAFCAGADIAATATVAASPVPVNGAPAEGRFGYLRSSPKPIIAAINGAAAGVGLTIALACDLRFVAAGAKLTTAFARRGLAAEDGLAWLLPRLIGPMHAADLALTGRIVLAEEADRLGLARVLPAETFRFEVQRYASELANLSSPRAVGIIKRQLREAWTQDFAQAVAVSAVEIERCRQTEDFREGVAHFIEKRRPAFTGF